MPYLDAALAFALTMLAVATLVTSIVRLIKNTATVRREGLKKMLEEYFAAEFKPVIQRELNRLKKGVDEKVTAELEAALNQYDISIEVNKAEAEQLADLATDELLERLKRSNLGQKLLTDLGDQAQAIFDELGKRYEVVGKKATESFRVNSKKWATGIALALALVVNIDSIYIANTYINNASLTQAVIAQKDAFVEDYNALVRTLEEEEDKETFTKEQLKQAFSDSQEQLKVVTGSGFPLGWSYFPHSYFQGAASKEWGKSQDFQNRANLLGWLSWITGVLITAVLAGQGGPFWYDVVASISRIVQSTRAAAKKPEE